jgi:transmembrane protein
MEIVRKPRAIAAGIELDIDNILDRHWLLVGGRVAITFMYWFAGIGFLLNFPASVEMIRGYGLEPAAWIAGVMVFVLLIGSALVIEGRLVWLGAGMLGVFTLSTIPTIHHFWTMTGTAAVENRLESEEHLTVIGGLILASILAHLENRRRPRALSRAVGFDRPAN